MQRVNIFFKFLLCILALNLFTGCSYLQKMQDRLQGRNQIVGSDDLSSANIDNRRGSDTGNIDGLSTVYFNLDSSGLSEAMKKTLKDNKKWFEKNRNVKKIEIEGHCDSLGSEAYNIGLGQRRAQSVANYLKSIGLSSNKISLISYGEEKPISQTDGSRNRRVNFVPIY